MNKQRIQDAINVILEEVNSEELDPDKVIYQIYCEANRFIADEIKRIIKEEGSATKDHPDLAPLYKLHDVIMVPMRRYSNMVEQSEQESKQRIESYKN